MHRRHFNKAALCQQLAYRHALIVAMFEQQPAAGPEMRGRVARDDADRVESVGAGGERTGRLEAQIALLQVGVARCDIRRIADDDIETHVAECAAPITLSKFDIANAEARSVAARDFYSVG